MARQGASIAGRHMAGRWDGENTWGVPTFIVTHRFEEQLRPSPLATFITYRVVR